MSIRSLHKCEAILTNFYPHVSHNIQASFLLTGVSLWCWFSKALATGDILQAYSQKGISQEGMNAIKYIHDDITREVLTRIYMPVSAEFYLVPA